VRTVARGACLAFGALLAACGGGHDHDVAATAAPGVARALAGALAAADDVTAPWRCTAADTPELATARLATGDGRWEVSGHALRRTDPAAQTVIGVIADAGGAAPPTLAALGRLRAKLAEARPDLVISLGGMGTTRDELEATLGVMADQAPWPVVAPPGDLEAMPAHEAALAALTRRGDTVVDGWRARWIELPGASLATLPGAGPARLAAGPQGCAWRAEEIAPVYEHLAAAKGLRIALTAEAPRSAVGGEATGEVALTPTAAIDVVVHGPTAPAPSAARHGTRDGRRVALSPGTSDAMPRSPRTRSPSAGLLVIRRGTWRWTPLLAD